MYKIVKKEKHSTKEALDKALDNYQFLTYKNHTFHENQKPDVEVEVTKQQRKEIENKVDAINIVRDMINTPPNHMMPMDIYHHLELFCGSDETHISYIKGDDLHHQFEGIYNVGKASSHEPMFIKLTYGDRKNPHVYLIGKGVCFDSGGLDIKPPSGMRNMKTDMAGSAHVIALAHYIIDNKLPIYLTVMIPAVENAIGSRAYRPGDVIEYQNGLTVEVGDTDAEGRLILADCLLEASNDGCRSNDLIIDFATLTGAARVALGLEISAMFSNNQTIANQLLKSSERMSENIHQLPLHKGYEKDLESDIADICNCGSSRYGGAITAALFLQHFVKKSTNWVHFDIYAYNDKSTHGHPKGGEANCLLTVIDYLEKRYANK